MIKIIYEDEDIIIINKPSGITVNTADTTKGEITVQEWAENKLNIKNENTKDNEQDDFYNRGGIVHRLDKETSGILIIAKNVESFKELQRQFKERIVKKTYLALVHGKVTLENGEINVPVGRLPWNRRQFGVVAGGREAITKYKVLGIKYLVSGNKSEELSFLELYPETGRTHQIRVHLKYIGHPIFGDFLYAGRKTQREDRKNLSRVFLHASKINFIHPRSKKSLLIDCPLSEDLEACMNNLV